MDALSFAFGLMAGLAISCAVAFITYFIVCFIERKKED